MKTKQVDSKGRLMLGSEYAGKLMIVDNSDPQKIILIPAITVPEKEHCLYQNSEVLQEILKGLKEAKEGSTLT